MAGEGDGGLSPRQLEALACVLDEIVPPHAEGGLPGAGELGIGAVFEAAAREQAELARTLAEGLAALDERARARGGEGYAGLPRESRLEVLNETGAAAPAFLPSLIGQTLVHYYQDARVRGALGLQTRPPYPEGYEVPPTDFARLDRVRARGAFYREA